MQGASKYVSFALLAALLAFPGKRNSFTEAESSITLMVPETPLESIPDSVRYSREFGALDSLFAQLHKRRNFNGVALVSRDGHIIFRKAFGYSDMRKRSPLREKSLFQLASVSKQFTAAAIMLLKQSGKLDYDDPVEKHIPEFPYRGVTIRHLLTHRSGLPNYMYFAEGYSTDTDTPMSASEMLDMMVRHRPGTYLAPNKKFNYCNTNYALLALVVERVSGASFGNFMRKQIFDPLKMNNTFVEGEVSGHPLSTIGYKQPRVKAEHNLLDGVLGDKGVYSCVDDMMKWDIALHQGTLLDPETLQEAFENYNPTAKIERRKYGFGWRIGSDGRGKKVVWHGGWWHGYNTYFARRLDDRTCVVILSNVSNKSFFGVKQEIFNILDRDNSGSPDQEDDEGGESVSF